MHSKFIVLIVLLIIIGGCGGGSSGSSDSSHDNANPKLVLGESKWGGAKWKSE